MLLIKGEYGFDWLRDEYIYSMKVVLADMWSLTPSNLNMFTPLCKDPINLRKEYLPNVEPPEKEFKPHGQDYYPAWLSIFACNVQGDNADAGSNMYEHGVYLDLQLDEIDESLMMVQKFFQNKCSMSKNHTRKNFYFRIFENLKKNRGHPHTRN